MEIREEDGRNCVVKRIKNRAWRAIVWRTGKKNLVVILGMTKAVALIG